MILLKKFREKRIDDIIDRVNKKNLVKRYTMLFAGCLIVAFAFNLFFLSFLLEKILNPRLLQLLMLKKY